MGDGTASERPTLDHARMRAWLLGPQVVDRDGRVWSWHCDAHPGYPYPEAGGLWLTWAIDELDADHPCIVAVARWLSHELMADRIGRDGLAYTFDLGVVLRGLVGWSRAAGMSPSPALVVGARRLCAALVERRAAWGTGPLPERWSTRFGAHQLKLLFALAEIERAGICTVDRARAAVLECMPPCRDVPRYLHAHAYALEGLALGLACGIIDADRGPELDRELEQLVLAQRADGGLPGWSSDDAGDRAPARSDATAQAVRLWTCRDRLRWGGSIASGLGFLARMARAGGVRYDDGSDDRNVWCTLFALQAAQLAAGEADVTRLL